MKPLIYIAGPYTNPDPVENTNKAILFADSLIEVCNPVVPHLSLLWHMVAPHGIDFWYEYDLAILKRCDGLIRMEGASTGADREVDVARQCRIPVFMCGGGWSLRYWIATLTVGVHA